MEVLPGRRPGGRRVRPRATLIIALRPILIPIALTVLFAFVIGPVVGLLERRIGRVTAVALVVIGLWSVLGAVAWGVGWRMASFARELPQYRVQLRAKVARLRNRLGGPSPRDALLAAGLTPS